MFGKFFFNRNSKTPTRNTKQPSVDCAASIDCGRLCLASGPVRVSERDYRTGRMLRSRIKDNDQSGRHGPWTQRQLQLYYYWDDWYSPCNHLAGILKRHDWSTGTAEINANRPRTTTDNYYDIVTQAPYETTVRTRDNTAADGDGRRPSTRKTRLNTPAVCSHHLFRRRRGWHNIVID